MPSEPKAVLSDTQLTRLESVCGAKPAGVVELEGGMVGTVYRVTFEDRSPVAVKVGETPLHVEGRMLRYLAAHTDVPAPAVLAADADLLVMAYVEGDGVFDAAVERASADCLAGLHDVSADQFGFAFDTLSGPYWQPNPWTDSWIEFFRDQRLLQFAEKAQAAGTLPDAYRRRIDTLASQLDDLLIEPDAPSLVHGDFHGANMVVQDGEIEAVLDPAIYFAHDELELAYVDRLDGFGDRFFERYATHRDIADGFFTTRRHVYTAFHALENVRFFGPDRLDRVDDALDRVGI